MYKSTLLHVDVRSLCHTSGQNDPTSCFLLLQYSAVFLLTPVGTSLINP